MRQSFARFLQEGTKDGLTNGEQIIRTLIQKAKDGDMKAIEYVLDRMGGKPLQSVEVGTQFSSNLISEADRIRAIESVKRIKQMQAEEGATRQLVGRAFTLAPPTLECKTPTETAPVSGEENRVRVLSEKRPCIHGFAVHANGATQCLICSSLGLQMRC